VVIPDPGAPADGIVIPMRATATTSLDAALAGLRGRVAGPVLDPRSPGSDEVRQVWNGASTGDPP
jgi:hypothetical protein